MIFAFSTKRHRYWTVLNHGDTRHTKTKWIHCEPIVYSWELEQFFWMRRKARRAGLGQRVRHFFLRFKKMKHMSTQHAIAEKNLDCIFSKLERANSLLGHMHCRKISERIELGRHKKNWKFEIQKVDAFRFTVIHWTTILFVGLRTL